MTSKINTYSLLDKNLKNSNIYYHEIIDFTNLVLDKHEKSYNDILEDYLSFLNRKELDLEIDKREAILEILLTGVLCEIYIEKINNYNSLLIKISSLLT
ncbi:hypothetical protein [Natronospora cellulosivora (SeqCode)]